jgi:NAD(P)-dependent dehydrogenase (short-subunit alcohol dehydrogenase family)
LGRLDVLVNNAAVYLDKGVSVFDLPLDHLKETLSVNLLGAFMLCKTFVLMMERNGHGRVVNVSSNAGDIKSMDGRGAVYKISKAVLNALTRVVAHEVRHRNVKINAMTPGWVYTRMEGRHAPRSPRQGADTAVWLATLPIHGPTDQYFYEREPRGW